MPAINLTENEIRQLATTGKQRDVYDTKQKGLIVRVNASGLKTYVALYDRGKRKSIGAFGEMSLTEARNRTRELQVAANKGQIEVELKKEQEDANEMTYAEYLTNVYYSHLVTKRKTGKETYKMLLSAFSKTFGCKTLPIIVTLKLSKITFSIIEKWTQEALISGLEASSVNRYMVSFKASLNYAIKGGYLKTSPAVDVEPSQEKETKERYLTEDEEPKFYKTLKPYPLDEFKVKAILGVKSGPRPCEAASLALCDIDLRRETTQVWFDAAYTKTTRKRFTPLGRLARITLYLYLRKKFRPQGINVFKTFRRVEKAYQVKIFERGGIPHAHRKTWASFVRKAGIEEFTPYDMRHDFISKFVMKTGDTYTCAKLVGTSVTMIEKNYGHLAPKFAASRIAALD